MSDDTNCPGKVVCSVFASIECALQESTMVALASPPGIICGSARWSDMVQRLADLSSDWTVQLRSDGHAPAVGTTDDVGEVGYAKPTQQVFVWRRRRQTLDFCDPNDWTNSSHAVTDRARKRPTLVGLNKAQPMMGPLPVGDPRAGQRRSDMGSQDGHSVTRFGRVLPPDSIVSNTHNNDTCKWCGKVACTYPTPSKWILLFHHRLTARATTRRRIACQSYLCVTGNTMTTVKTT